MRVHADKLITHHTYHRLCAAADIDCRKLRNAQIVAESSHIRSLIPHTVNTCAYLFAAESRGNHCTVAAHKGTLVGFY